MKRNALLLGLALAASAAAREVAGAPLQEGTSDPYDGRHVELAAFVSRDRIVIESVAVRPAIAHAQLARSSGFRIRLLDARGEVLQESGLPDPLAVRIYHRREPATDDSGGAGPEAPPHAVVQRREAAVTILLPLLPGLAAVRLGWSGGAATEADVREGLTSACRKDEHPACRRWLESTER